MARRRKDSTPKTFYTLTARASGRLAGSEAASGAAKAPPGPESRPPAAAFRRPASLAAWMVLVALAWTSVEVAGAQGLPPSFGICEPRAFHALGADSSDPSDWYEVDLVTGSLT